MGGEGKEVSPGRCFQQKLIPLSRVKNFGEHTESGISFCKSGDFYSPVGLQIIYKSNLNLSRVIHFS